MESLSRAASARQEEKAIGPEAWLDRHRWAPVVLLLILPWAVHLPQWLLGLSTDPIWQNLGAVLGTRLGVFNGWPNTDPNAGWTTEALGRLAALDWVHGIVPWWNSYAGIGMPLAGEMQPAAFFFPFVLLLLLPGGVLWLGIAADSVAGLAAFALCRELGLGRLAALAGGALFALNGTLAWFAHAPAFPVPFLAVLLFGIERARQPASAASGIFWTGIGIGWLILAGFPETAYIAGLFALLWASFRFVSAASGRVAFASRVIAGGMLGLLLAAPQLVAFADYLAQSEIVRQYRMGSVAASWHAFPSFLMPYVYGPLTQFWGNHRLWLIMVFAGGYSGVVLLLLAARGVLPVVSDMRREQGLRFLLLAWVLLAWAKSFGLSPVQALMNRIPFLLQIDFMRYAAPSWELALILLAAFALDDLARERWRLRLPILLTLALLGAAVGLAWPLNPSFDWPSEMLPKMFGLLWIALGIAATGLACTLAVRLLSTPRVGRAPLALIAFAEAALLFAAPELNGVHPGQIDWPAMRFLAEHLGLERFYSAGPLQPNYGGYFGFAGINHATAPTPALWNRYVREKLFPPFADTSGEIFWSGEFPDASLGWRELLAHLPDYEALGVRYLLTEPDASLLPVVRLAGESSEDHPLPLAPGEAATVSFPAPAPPPNGHLLEAVGVLIGNYFNSSDGRLFVRACSPAGCVAGARPLAGSVDNRVFFVPFEQPLALPAGTALRLEIHNAGGTHPVALWLGPQPAGVGQTLRGPAGRIPNRTLGLALRYQDPGFPLRDVYSDSVMTIWELPDPKPYFSIASGGPCVLRFTQRLFVEATCDTPAILLRRELFMPGWQAHVNGSRAALELRDEIFQSVSLPQGESRVQFRFAPPGIAWAWLAAAVAILGFVFVFRAMLREQRGAWVIAAGGNRSCP